MSDRESASGGPSRRPADPVASLVTGYLIEQVKEVASADRELLDRALELYQAVETGGLGDGSTDRIAGILESGAFRVFSRLLGKRARHLAEVGLRLARDNRVIMAELRSRLVEAGLDAARPEHREAAVAWYERILAATVSLDTSLENVAAVADTIDLANDILNPSASWKATAFRRAWPVLARLVIEDEGLRVRVDELREELSGDPARLEAMAAIVRDAGPGVVRRAYRRAAELDDVLT